MQNAKEAFIKSSSVQAYTTAKMSASDKVMRSIAHFILEDV